MKKSIFIRLSALISLAVTGLFFTACPGIVEGTPQINPSEKTGSISGKTVFSDSNTHDRII